MISAVDPSMGPATRLPFFELYVIAVAPSKQRQRPRLGFHMNSVPPMALHASLHAQADSASFEPPSCSLIPLTFCASRLPTLPGFPHSAEVGETVGTFVVGEAVGDFVGHAASCSAEAVAGGNCSVKIQSSQ